MLNKSLHIGHELRIQVLLPNGVKILAIDTTPVSIKTVWFYFGNDWYLKCPPLRTTESDIIASTTSAESSTEDNSEDFAFDPLNRPTKSHRNVDQNSEEYPTEIDENHEIESSKQPLEDQENETNTIIGHILVQSKAKISNLFGFLNLTLS